MTTHTGIDLDAYATVDGNSPMKYQVRCGEARLELVHGTGSFYLTMNEAGLTKLAQVTDAALHEIRAGDRRQCLS
jgi:hypothetical protein